MLFHSICLTLLALASSSNAAPTPLDKRALCVPSFGVRQFEIAPTANWNEKVTLQTNNSPWTIGVTDPVNPGKPDNRYDFISRPSSTPGAFVLSSALKPKEYCLTAKTASGNLAKANCNLKEPRQAFKITCAAGCVATEPDFADGCQLQSVAFKTCAKVDSKTKLLELAPCSRSDQRQVFDFLGM